MTESENSPKKTTLDDLKLLAKTCLENAISKIEAQKEVQKEAQKESEENVKKMANQQGNEQPHDYINRIDIYEFDDTNPKEASSGRKKNILGFMVLEEAKLNETIQEKIVNPIEVMNVLSKFLMRSEVERKSFKKAQKAYSESNPFRDFTEEDRLHYYWKERLSESKYGLNDSETENSALIFSDHEKDVLAWLCLQSHPRLGNFLFKDERRLFANSKSYDFNQQNITDIIDTTDQYFEAIGEDNLKQYNQILSNYFEDNPSEETLLRLAKEEQLLKAKETVKELKSKLKEAKEGGDQDKIKNLEFKLGEAVKNISNQESLLKKLDDANLAAENSKRTRFLEVKAALEAKEKALDDARKKIEDLERKLATQAAEKDALEASKAKAQEEAEAKEKAQAQALTLTQALAEKVDLKAKIEYTKAQLELSELSETFLKKQIDALEAENENLKQKLSYQPEFDTLQKAEAEAEKAQAPEEPPVRAEINDEKNESLQVELESKKEELAKFRVDLAQAQEDLAKAKAQAEKAEAEAAEAKAEALTQAKALTQALCGQDNLKHQVVELRTEIEDQKDLAQALSKSQAEAAEAKAKTQALEAQKAQALKLAQAQIETLIAQALAKSLSQEFLAQAVEQRNRKLQIEETKSKVETEADQAQTKISALEDKNRVLNQDLLNSQAEVTVLKEALKKAEVQEARTLEAKAQAEKDKEVSENQGVNEKAVIKIQSLARGYNNRKDKSKNLQNLSLIGSSQTDTYTQTDPLGKDVSTQTEEKPKETQESDKPLTVEEIIKKIDKIRDNDQFNLTEKKSKINSGKTKFFKGKTKFFNTNKVMRTLAKVRAIDESRKKTEGNLGEWEKSWKTDNRKSQFYLTNADKAILVMLGMKDDDIKNIFKTDPADPQFGFNFDKIDEGNIKNIMDVAFELINKIERGELTKYEGKEFKASKGGERYKIDEKLDEEVSNRRLTYKKIDQDKSAPSTSVENAGAVRLKDYNLILSQ